MKKGWRKSLLWLFALVIVAELVSRAYLFGKIPQEHRPRGAEAARRFLSAGSYLCEFRGGQYLFEKPEGTFRIMAFGGSTTIGHSLHHDPWPRVLEKKLNERSGGRTRFEVINMGWWGATSAYEYYYLRQYGYLKPDLVIVYDGYNDVLYANAQPAAYLANTARVYRMLEAPSRREAVRHWLYRQSALVNRVHIYLYRTVSALNRLISERRWFGVGGERAIKAFETVEWYRHQEKAWNATARKQTDPRRWREAFEAGRIGEAEFRLARQITGAKEGPLLAADFVAKIVRAQAESQTKRNLLEAMDLDRIHFRIDGREFDYDLLDLEDYRRGRKDMFLELYAYNLGRISDYLKEGRMPGLFVFQPYLPEKAVRLEGGLDPERLSWVTLNINPDLYEMYGRFASGRQEAMERSVAGGGWAAHFDARRVFDAQEDRDVYIDMCHYTEAGVDILSDALLEALAGRGLLPAEGKQTPPA